MWQLFIGSLLLSIVHGMIPNHWIPLIAIGKSEKWTLRESLFATGMAGFAHTLSTVILGIIVGFVGYSLSSQFELVTSVIAPTILVAIGLVYLVLDYRHRNHDHKHDHINLEKVKKNRSKTAILGSLIIAMFFSPCLELEAFYFQAGTQGWQGIALISVVYTIVTVFMMMLLVYLGMRGVGRLKSGFLERYEKRITGILLILLGIMAYFVEF